MIFAACSTSLAFRSCIFVSAIWRSCSRVILPTLLRFGSPEPLSIPIASLISTAAGGVFVMKVNERSSKTVISTGVIRPGWSCVWALNAWQNSMMFTPCWPRAGPTGGAGLAAAPGTWSLMRVRTFFIGSETGGRSFASERGQDVGGGSTLLPLVETDLDRRLTAEDRDEHLELG